MNRMFQRVICLALCAVLCLGFAGCAAEGDELVEKALESIAGNEKIQEWMESHDLATVSEEAIVKFKESIPALKEFLAREDVKEKFETVGLPLIKEFLNYNIESWRLKAETLGNLIRIFAPELTAQVDAIFETAPAITENTEITENS